MKQATAFCVAALLYALGCTQLLASEQPPEASTPNGSSAVDCSEAYGKAASCRRVSCEQRYRTFLGTWQGDFWSYVREQSTNDKKVYRPYHNVITYSQADCLKNAKTGETFIIGRASDSYPAFGALPATVKRGLLITGRKANGAAFLRTVNESGTNDFSLVYQNTAASVSIWSLHIPASRGTPDMTFTTLDERDFTASPREKRNVTITMEVGPPSAPYWEGVIAYGSHTKA